MSLFWPVSLKMSYNLIATLFPPVLFIAEYTFAYELN